VAEEVGELVCASAGDHMEAMLAAHGSGAVAASAKGAGKRILNIDIGGATTKFAVASSCPSNPLWTRPWHWAVATASKTSWW
jgi:ethanolamine utilization protein EutA